MSIALAQPGSVSIEPTTIRRMIIRLTRVGFPDSITLRRRRWGFRDDLHLVAVSQVHGRLQYDLVAILDALVDLDLGAVIGG